MPYGVVALTGLAHLGINRGAIHTLSRSADSRVEAKLLVKLPGAPCDVIREGNQITMRIRTGYEETQNRSSKPIFSCYALRPDKNLVRYDCPAHRSEEHTSELQSLMRISYAVFCLKKKKE